MKNLLRSLFFVVLFGGSLTAQDIHFSQFYMSPLNLNPAMTGVMNCNSRLVANYRNQWASVLNSNAYNTYSVSYDTKIPVGRADYFGIGGSFWGDVAGESRFGTIQGRLSASYAKKMGGYRRSAHYLVVGADAAFTQRRISPLELRWPTQHDGNGGFDGTIDPGEPLINENITYMDLAMGMLWFSVLDDANNWYIGAAYHHLNEANVSFLGDESSLYAKYTVHGGGQFEMSNTVSLLPGFVIFSQGQQREYNMGTSVRFNVGGTRQNPQTFQVGAWYRLGRAVNEDQTTNEFHSDALIFSTRFEYDNYGIGFSYDINVSQLSEAAAANGAFEFSLNYYICGPERRNVYCPRF